LAETGEIVNSRGEAFAPIFSGKIDNIHPRMLRPDFQPKSRGEAFAPIFSGKIDNIHPRMLRPD
jgi:hypothetical protein